MNAVATSLTPADSKEYIISRKFIVERNEGAFKKLNWFNLWAKKQWPYDLLKVNDVMYFFERPSQKIVLKCRTAAVERFYYEDKPSVIRRIEDKFGKNQQDDNTNDYVAAAPDQGFCLAYKLEPLEWISIPRPEDFRFPQLGWANPQEDSEAKDWISARA